MTIYPTNFRLALDSREMSLTALSKKAGIPYKTLKRCASDLNQRYSAFFQPDGHEIPGDDLDAIAAWLKYPVNFFNDRPFQIFPVNICERSFQEAPY